jgi:multidrug resistance efflux pump
LESRGARHREVAAAWQAAQAGEAERLLAAARAREGRARREVERKARLAAAGFAAAADLDRARVEQDIAAREAEAQERRIAALRAQAAGLRQGVLVDAGHSGAAYAAQRLDEVALRLVEIGRSIAATRAESGALAVQLAEEERRSDRLRRAELPAPASGTLWRVLAQPGERLAPGDPVAEVVDCSAAFLLAALPQNQVARVRLGGAARVRLGGETLERRGAVQAILGEALAGQDHNLAALPSRPVGAVALVRIALEPATAGGGEACAVGRTARLLLPDAAGGGLYRRGLAAAPP